MSKPSYATPPMRPRPSSAYFIKANRLDEDLVNQPDVQLTISERMVELKGPRKEIGFETFILETASPF